MTNKLYYEDAYIREFKATVTSVTPEGDKFLITLDKTAFFPEEGGQSSDTGYIGDARILHVGEKEGVILHLSDKPLAVGCEYTCHISFDERFEKMQCHTAEHILSGYFNSIYGLDNVGFHLGCVDVTMDINGVLTRADLDRVETLANEAVFANLPVTASFPSAEALAEMRYRSKLDLKENVRIVKIGDIDLCACCAPHVARTGEIGIIKILDFEKHKGGLRIHITAGRRALRDYRTKYENILRISALLCEPQQTTAQAVEASLKHQAELASALKAARLDSVRRIGEGISETDGNLLLNLPELSADEMREIANTAMDKVKGLLVIVSGAEGAYKYLISSAYSDVGAAVKEINTHLCGKGGGRGNMAMGTFYTELSAIERYFSVN